MKLAATIFAMIVITFLLWVFAGKKIWELEDKKNGTRD